MVGSSTLPLMFSGPTESSQHLVWGYCPDAGPGPVVLLSP